ncbi:MAG: dTMP kinase [Candidatus Omnitrophica bacterium]|nr:dTMP kinase [Candidatus Omnitrophota bacterium]
MSSTRGFFITLEGIEGSGKSTQAKKLAAALRRRGYRVVLVRDPGSTALGRGLRRVLLHSRQALSPLSEALLFFAARLQLVEEQIRPALSRGSIVVCDRFHDSTIAYQGDAGGVDLAWLEQAGRRVVGKSMPDLTLVLDVPAGVGLKRLGGTHDRIEGKGRAFHERVRRGFRRLARREPKRIVLVDGTQPTSVLHRQILALVVARFTHHPSPITRHRS